MPHPVPKLSVIVCTYNQRGYISSALDSILAQNVDFPYEIILADDCSSDGTAEICRDYALRYPCIRLVENARNKGPVKNYIDCILAARGKYIADLAGDDIWSSPSKLRRQVEVMDSDPAIALCHTAWRYLRPDDSTEKPSGFHFPEEAYVADGSAMVLPLLREERHKAFIHLCTSLYRRDMATDVIASHPEVFTAPNLPCEDLQIAVMLASRGKIAWLPDVTVDYRTGHPSVSSGEDVMKTVRFTSRVLSLKYSLAKALGIPFSDIADSARLDMQYVCRRTLSSPSLEAVDMASRMVGESPVAPSFKTSVTLSLAKLKMKVKSLTLN